MAGEAGGIFGAPHIATGITQLLPGLVPYVRAFFNALQSAGLRPTITSTYRSHSEQVALYRAYKAGRNPYPVAPPGTSDHEKRVAFDLVCKADPTNEIAGDLWRRMGGRWAGAADRVHFTI